MSDTPVASAPPLKAFSERLETACTLRKVGGTMARVALLMNATGCCRGTALRWLSGRTTPAHGEQIVRIAGALDVDPSWLVGVASQSPLLAALTRKFLSLPPELQIEAVSLLDRLAINAEPARG